MAVVGPCCRWTRCFSPVHGAQSAREQGECAGGGTRHGPCCRGFQVSCLDAGGANPLQGAAVRAEQLPGAMGPALSPPARHPASCTQPPPAPGCPCLPPSLHVQDQAFSILSRLSSHAELPELTDKAFGSHKPSAWPSRQPTGACAGGVKPNLVCLFLPASSIWRGSTACLATQPAWFTAAWGQQLKMQPNPPPQPSSTRLRSRRRWSVPALSPFLQAASPGWSSKPGSAFHFGGQGGAGCRGWAA